MFSESVSKLKTAMNQDVPLKNYHKSSLIVLLKNSAYSTNTFDFEMDSSC
nr:MAG TPA: hypothetical protein [Caudoviricetes sp.]